MNYSGKERNSLREAHSERGLYMKGRTWSQSSVVSPDMQTIGHPPPGDAVGFVAFGLWDLEQVIKDSRVTSKDRPMDPKLGAFDLKNYGSVVEPEVFRARRLFTFRVRALSFRSRSRLALHVCMLW